MKPRYTHDCDKCKFIGRFREASEFGDKETTKGNTYFDVDVHLCLKERTRMSFVTLRYSDESSDNTSARLGDFMHMMLEGEILTEQ